MERALDGIRVLEFSQGWSAAALAGRLLGELGAEVVKVEPPPGDPLRREPPLAADGQGYAFHLVAATKRSLALEGRPEADRRSVEALLVWADLVVTDGAGAAALRSLGLRVDTLPDRWPHLVACAVTPFGLAGPLAGWAAGELTVQAMSGAMACTGYPDRPPTRAGLPLGAHVAGVLTATAALAALRVHERGGRGQLVDMAVHDCLVACLGTFLPTYFLTGKAPARQGNRHTMGSPWNAYPCRDGWAIICALSERQWVPLLRVMGRHDLVGDPRYASMEARVGRVDEVDAIVSAWTRTRATAEVIAAAERADVPAGPIVGIADLVGSPQAREREMVVEAPGAAGRPVPTAGPLCKMSLTPGRVERAGPALGEATEEILRAATDERARTRAPSTGENARPLEGVRFLEMGAYTAGPFVTRLLASLGADVIKIEPPRGDPARQLAQRLGGDGYLYHLYNTDKRSVTLDVTAPGGRAVLLALARRSDGFVENFAPGTAEAWGIGVEEVLAANPRLLYCSISGFGRRGPLSRKRAFDSVIQAMAGVLALTGEPEDPPVKVGLSVADLLGPCLASAALLAALRHRDRKGRGQHLDISMHDVTGWLTSEAWPPLLAGTGEPSRTGNRHRIHVPHNAYPAGDGARVAIEVRDDAEWRGLLGAMKRDDLQGDPDYATAAARRARAEAVDRLVAAWVAERTATEAMSACQAAGVPAGPVLSLPEVAEHPQARAREMVIVREHPAHGPIRLLGSPLKLTRPPAAVTRPAPALGAHTTEVYAALGGQTPDELQALRTAGVL